MLRHGLAVIAVALGVVGCSTSTVGNVPRQSPRAVGGNVARGARSVNRLALALLRKLDRATNVVFSPYSIQAALGMADAGASGETAAQIARVLGTGGHAQLAADAKALRKQLAATLRAPAGAPASDVPQLEIANGLWVQAGLTLEPPFASTLAGDFGSAAQTVDFHNQPEAARQAINSWIENHTASLIKNLFPAGAIDVRTALVLANAIYLKAHWSSPFVPSLTAKRGFVTASGNRVRVPFMTQVPTDFAYASGRGYKAVRLPYLYSALSMLVIMPSPGTMADFERRLSVATLERLQSELRFTLVDLKMPRFHLALRDELTPVLESLGMPIAFSDAADFSAITRRPRLKIAHVQHGADLMVDEHGTVASAATGISFTPTSARGGPLTHLTLDHPFLVLLRDDRSGATLFVARVGDPTMG
jgi:serpin B